MTENVERMSVRFSTVIREGTDAVIGIYWTFSKDLPLLMLGSGRTWDKNVKKVWIVAEHIHKMCRNQRCVKYMFKMFKSIKHERNVGKNAEERESNTWSRGKKLAKNNKLIKIINWIKNAKYINV